VTNVAGIPAGELALLMTRSHHITFHMERTVKGFKATTSDKLIAVEAPTPQGLRQAVLQALAEYLPLACYPEKELTIRFEPI
jgi:hypothetical protein